MLIWQSAQLGPLRTQGGTSRPLRAPQRTASGQVRTPRSGPSPGSSDVDQPDRCMPAVGQGRKAPCWPAHWAARGFDGSQHQRDGDAQVCRDTCQPSMSYHPFLPSWPTYHSYQRHEHSLVVTRYTPGEDSQLACPPASSTEYPWIGAATSRRDGHDGNQGRASNVVSPP